MKKVAADVPLLALAVSLTHLGLSWMGFNPTDDGWVLAQSRRLLNGERPHFEFDSVRPAGSALLHLPELCFGHYVFWASRLVYWTQWWLVGWCWAFLLMRLLDIKLRPRNRFCVVAIVVFLSCFAHPMTASADLDALTLFSLGVVLMETESTVTGALLLGLAMLCKQTFAPGGVAVLCVYRARCGRKALAALVLPPLLYLGALAASSPSDEPMTALTDLFSLTKLFWNIGLEPYLWLLAGAAGVWLVAGHVTTLERWPRWLPGVAALAYTLSWLARMRFDFWHNFPAEVALEPCVICAVLGVWAWRHERPGVARAVGLLLLAAWSIALSLGNQTPMYMAGPAIGCLLLLGYQHALPLRDYWRALPLCVALVVVGRCVQFMSEHPYRQQPAAQLKYPLGDVLPGGALIYTDEPTSRLFADLHRAIALQTNSRYAIVPDFACWWVESAQRNPLRVDWPLGYEGGNWSARIAWLRYHHDITFIVEKYRADSISYGHYPFWRQSLQYDYAVVQDVHENLHKYAETEYFELYHSLDTKANP